MTTNLSRAQICLYRFEVDNNLPLCEAQFLVGNSFPLCGFIMCSWFFFRWHQADTKPSICGVSTCINLPSNTICLVVCACAHAMPFNFKPIPCGFGMWVSKVKYKSFHCKHLSSLILALCSMTKFNQYLTTAKLSSKTD